MWCVRMPLIEESAKDVTNVIVGVSSTGLPPDLEAGHLEFLRSSLLGARRSLAGQPAVGTGTAAGSAKPFGNCPGSKFSKAFHF
jgi:hypothetical protein